jgi:aerobic carbon-monoxide dehydrogenase medium subunit
MYEFTYHRPATIEDAVRLLKGSEAAKVMSGGQTLIPTLKQRLAQPSDIVDLSGLRNTGVSVSGSTITIKAGTCHAEVAESRDVAKAIPALAALAGLIGDPQVRHMGTLGGSIANNDPAADYPAAVVALNGTVVTTARRIAADQFFTGMFETALDPSEIVTAVEFAVPQRAGYQKFRNPASRYAMVGVFVADHGGGNVRVAVTGAGPCVFRQRDMEAALARSFTPDAVKGIGTDPANLNSDIHASADYRAHLVGVMARRAVEAALAG